MKSGPGDNFPIILKKENDKFITLSNISNKKWWYIFYNDK